MDKNQAEGYQPLEKIEAFFNSRIDSYEAHMLQYANNIYALAAQRIPKTKGLKLLDLGCGTGLELDEIFKVNPTVQFTGIDLAESMLEKLRQKHAARQNQITLILEDYFKYDFGAAMYDVVLSIQTLHHFIRVEKIKLYRKILAALKPAGFYLESDYIAKNQEFEEYRLSENKRLRAAQGIKEGYYHYDIPYTVEHQVKMLQRAGFGRVKIIERQENGAMLEARP